MNISSTLQQKNFAKRYASRLVLLMLVPLIAFIWFFSFFEKPNQIVIADNAFNTCEFDQALQHAKQLGLTVENTDRFGWYKFVGKNQAVDEFQTWYFSREDITSEKICDVHNLRQLVKNVKPALLPYIPNNADFVSYHPTQNKAVYCRYHYHNYLTSTQKQIGSQCEFVMIEGKQLVSYDISDMERNNLDWWRDNRYFPFEIYQANSYVAKWEDKPTTYFGFQLLTAVNYSNFGFGQDY